MRNPRGVGAVLVVGLAALSGTANADPPFDPAIDVQTFDYAIGPKSFFSIADANVATKKQLAVDALFTYLTKPFTIYNVDTTMNNKITGVRSQVVKSMTAAQITAAYGINEKLQLGVNLPIVFQMDGDGLDPATGMHAAQQLKVTGLGDMIVQGKYALYRKKELGLAGLVGVTIPTSFGSDGSQFLGDNLPTLRAGVAFQYDVQRLTLGVNGGVLFRKPRKIYDSTVGQQLTWGTAAAFRVTERFSVIGEAYGRKSMFDSSLDASPLEIEGGLRIYATTSVAVVLGGGAGVLKGIGSPSSRFFLSVGYAPDERDSDGDGIPNSRDKCPLVPEDKDGFQDEDGCPDDDNDGDRRPDATDKCPNEAEDIDGFEDDDGCPDLDNDKDGIPDLQDKCPNEAEDGKMPFPKDGCPANRSDADGDGIMDADDKCPTEPEDEDGFEDGDGCPELDNDGDGIPDATDKCPLCAEDKDGFQDEDGCPELDNDHDGIPDVLDKCPNDPETLNGFKDDDGCPDAGAENVKLDGDGLVITAVPALAGTKLTVSGTQLVDEVVQFLNGHTEITKLLLAVAQPKAANAEILKAAIAARLKTRGIADGRVDIIAAAGPPKMGGVVQERGGSDEPFVCPAEFQAHERPGTSKGDKKPEAVAPTTTKPTGPDAALQDRDGDDIADADDKCPDQPETKNDYQDDDGCPDTVPTALKQFTGSIQGVNFKSGSAELLASSFKILDGAAKAFGEFPDLKVEIQGHTDDVPPGAGGKFADNLALSQARADAVKDYLTKKGVPEAKLKAKGYGDTVPLVPFADAKASALAAARAKNRRVEFKLLSGDKP